MKFQEINETQEKLFIAQVYDMQYKTTYYVRTLDYNSVFSLTPVISEALPVTKEQWESCYLREMLLKKTYRKELSWGSEDKQKYRLKLTKYIPDVKDLIPVYVQVTDSHFGLTDVKKYFKKSGIAVLITEKGRYSLQYSRDFKYYSILYIREQDLETAEALVKSLKNQIDIGFAEPDRRVSASDKLTYR